MYRCSARWAPPYRAHNWLLFGREEQLIIGAGLIFSRGSGGHAGFAIGKDDAHFYWLGGNHSDAVTIARIANSWLLGARWPATYPPSSDRRRHRAGGKGLRRSGRNCTSHRRAVDHWLGRLVGG